MNDNIYFDPNDVNRNKALVIISLIFSILFFLPLVACPDSRYGRFFANQGLLLFILSAAAGVVGRIPFIGWIVAGIAGLLVLIGWIIVIIGAAQGTAARVPIIGYIEIIK
ncbi:MAG: hypothetical protein K2K57_01045 [Oscillospiraceae bacterium]|nr:hypothetical protein [Oscillospiraceae bacterium]